MTHSIQGTNLDLSGTIRELVEEKLSEALRPLGRADRESVHVAVELKRYEGRYDESANTLAYRAEATVTGLGSTFRAEGTAEELGPAIVEMKRKLSRQVRRWRERRRDARRTPTR